MQVIIDRFEGEFAVCEKDNGEMINIKTTKLPLDVKALDVITINGDKYKINIEETKRRKKEIKEGTKEIWK